MLHSLLRKPVERGKLHVVGGGHVQSEEHLPVARLYFGAQPPSYHLLLLAHFELYSRFELAFDLPSRWACQQPRPANRLFKRTQQGSVEFTLHALYGILFCTMERDLDVTCFLECYVRRATFVGLHSRKKAVSLKTWK
jgi:hypothetical protein